MNNNQKQIDWELRKRLRLEQVRQQSKEFAHDLRKKMYNEQKVKLKEIEHTKQAEHKNWQRKSLNEINQEYIQCLRNIGTSHANAMLGKSIPIEEKREKPAHQDNIYFNQKSCGRPEKLLPAVIGPNATATNLVSKPKFIKPTSTKVKPVGTKKKKPKERDNTDSQSKQYIVTSHDPINLTETDKIGLLETKPTASQNTDRENKENENIVPEFGSKPYFSQVSSLLKRSSLPQSTSQDLNENPVLAPEFDSKPYFSQISNLLKKTTPAQIIAQENNENPAIDNKPHFSQISNLLKQRNQARKTITAAIPSNETEETNLKRRPSVVSFKSTNDAFSVPFTANELSCQPAVYDNGHLVTVSGGPRQPTLDSKVQMYDNRTKFAKEYIPQHSLTQRTSTNRESPNAMDLADQENERRRVYLNSVDERLKKDLERGENAIEREKLIRKYKTLLNELDKLSIKEKTLKSYILSHQPSQYEPKMQNMRDFIEKRTIITSSEVRKQNSNYINVASIKSASSNQSEDSRKSIVLDYEESLILENLSETNVNVDTIHRFAKKVSPMISGKSAKETETQTSVGNDEIQIVKAQTTDSNDNKLFDVPVKITIQIQQGDRQEPMIITPKETNIRLSQLESNSSSLTEYKSLPKTFTDSSRPPAEQIVTTGMSKPSQKYEDAHQTTYKQIVKESELECYIRRLLQMSKESVDELPNITDLPSIRESIVNTISNTEEQKHSEVENIKAREQSIQFKNRAWNKEDEVNFSGNSFSSSVSISKPTQISIRKATSYSILSNSSENGNDVSKQFNALTQNCNQRIIELTDLMSKVRIERQQILERTSLSSSTANVPNNSTEYHELPSRLHNVQQKVPFPPLGKFEENKRYQELSTIKEMGKTTAQSNLEKSSSMNVNRIMNEVFTQASSDRKIEVVPYQSEEKLEETIQRSDSQESLLDIYAELKRRNILPSGMKKLGSVSEYRNQSPKLLQPSNDDETISIATESLLSISSSINFNRRSLQAHSISSNGKSSSSASSLSKPALNLKEFLERELSKKNSSSDSGTISEQRDVDKGHRTSTPVTKQSSSKSLYLSVDAQNLFSGESQISSVKSNTTTSTWDSA